MLKRSTPQTLGYSARRCVKLPSRSYGRKYAGLTTMETNLSGRALCYNDMPVIIHYTMRSIKLHRMRCSDVRSTQVIAPESRWRPRQPRRENNSARARTVSNNRDLWRRPRTPTMHIRVQREVLEPLGKARTERVPFYYRCNTSHERTDR